MAHCGCNLSIVADSYHLNFKEDRRWLKALVYTIFIVETAQTGVVARDVFETLARGWGDTTAVFSIETQWLTAPIMDGLSK